MEKPTEYPNGNIPSVFSHVDYIEHVLLFHGLGTFRAVKGYFKKKKICQIFPVRAELPLRPP